MINFGSFGTLPLELGSLRRRPILLSTKNMPDESNRGTGEEGVWVASELSLFVGMKSLPIAQQCDYFSRQYPDLTRLSWVISAYYNQTSIDPSG